MTPRLKISKPGLDFIKAHEGYRRTAAELPDGRWVIGYSHTQTARQGVSVSPEDAEALLMHDLKPVEEAVNDLVFAPLTQNQFDALVSLAFNIGVRQFRLSGIVRHINEGRPLDAASCFDVWRRVEIDRKPVVVDALVRRRASEKAMFLTPKTGPIAAPTAEAPVLADPDAVYVAPMETAVAAKVDLNGTKAGVRGAVRREKKDATQAQAAADAVVERLNQLLPASDKDDDARASLRSRDYAGGRESAFTASRPPVSEIEAPPPAFDPEEDIEPSFEAPRPEPWDGDVSVEAPLRAGSSDQSFLRPWTLGAAGFAVMMVSVYGIAANASLVEPSMWRGLSFAGLIFGALSVFSSVFLALRRAGRLIDE